MPVCGYVVVPGPGEADAAARAVSRIEGCEVVQAENREVLLLVTDTASEAEDRELRQRLNAVPGIQALLMTFGEIDPHASPADPKREGQL
jgi:nitrate reductase NapAB chaperone NapD